MTNERDKILDYEKWNRRLMNCYWLCNVIVLVTELILFAYLYYLQSFWFPPDYHLIHLILVPALFMFFFTLLCEALVFVLRKRYKSIQPYIITFTCIAYCAILLKTHYTINLLSAAFMIPVIFAVIYDSKRVLLATFLCSFFTLTGLYFFYLLPSDLPYLSLTPIDIISTMALLIASYLICKTILNRVKEIIGILVAANREVFESKLGKNRAEAAAEARERFLANVSHEIRTPMNGIMGLTELALDEQEVPEKLRNYLGSIKNSAEGLLSIINDILDISKIDAGEITQKKVPFNVHDVLNDCQEIVSPKANEKGLALRFENGIKTKALLIGDPSRLRQAILNILSNAVKFTDTGYVMMSVYQAETNLQSEVVTVSFEIKDTGIGMTKDQCEIIFEPFKQVDDKDTRNFGGTGLGLSIAKRLIEIMGGSISVESVPQIGSKFLVTIPFEATFIENPQTTKTPVIEEKPIFSGEVLVCEDNQINQVVIAESLKRVGLYAFIVANGQQAIELVLERQKENKPFQLILMDIHMPEVDGLLAAKTLIDAGITTPIIAMTANARQEDRQRCLNIGMADYLGKPFKLHELYACLSQHIEALKE